MCRTSFFVESIHKKETKLNKILLREAFVSRVCAENTL